MTTLTQHSPSLSSPAIRNDSNDYFSVSKNDLLDIHMSSPKQIVNDIKIPTSSSTISTDSDNPVPLPKWPLQNSHVHTNIDISSQQLSPTNNHKSLGFEELSLRESAAINHNSNNNMSFFSSSNVPNNIIDNSHLTVSHFNPKNSVNNGALINNSLSTTVNPFDSQFMGSSPSEVDSKKKKLHNMKLLKSLSSSPKNETSLQSNQNFNFVNVATSNSQPSSKNSSSSSVHRSVSTNRKKMSPHSSNLMSSNSSSKTTASTISASKSPTYNHSHVHSPTYQTTATANTKLPAYLMAAAASSNQNLTSMSSIMETSSNNNLDPSPNASYKHLSLNSPAMNYSAQSLLPASSANSSSSSTINSIAPSKTLNHGSNVSSVKKNTNHIHPQSSTLNAMAAAAASAGSKPRFSAYAQSLHQTHPKGNTLSPEFDFNKSNRSGNRMSVMSTSSDIMGYTSQNYYKYYNNNHLKSSLNNSIDEDSLEEYNRPSSKSSNVMVNQPSMKPTDESIHKQQSLAVSPNNNNQIYRTRTGNLSVSSLPSFNFNSSNFQRKLSNLNSSNTGGTTKAYQKVILRKHQKLNQNSSDIAQNFRFGLQPNGSVANGVALSEEAFSLPENVHGMSADSLNSHFCSNNSDNIRLIAVVDIRTFNEYAKKRITKAVNISLPTTLLKRKNYSLLRTISQLSEAEKLIFLPYVASSEDTESQGEFRDSSGLIPSVVLYDSSTTPSENDDSEFLINFNLYYMSVKFAKGWKGNTYVLNGGLKEFCSKYPNMVISPSNSGGSLSSNSTGTDKSMSSKNSDHSVDLSFNNSLSNHSDLNLSSNQGSHYNNNYSDIGSNFSNDNNLDMIHKANDDFNSQRSDDDVQSISSVNSGFSGFELPSAKYFFRVRQNDELVNVGQCVKHLKLKNAEKIPPGFEFEMDKENTEYPLNIDEYEDSENDPRINSIVRKFKQLEINEKTRINESLVKFHGVEMGLKNRYKDILPFDYNRVLLKGNDSSSADATPTYERGFRFDFNSNVYNDYINASNISIDLSKYGADKSQKLSCIASQAPLQNTVDDFINMIKQNKIALIVTLTDCVENMVDKCYKFWDCQTSQYKISVDESFNTDADLEIKILKIEDTTEGDMAEKNMYVVQLHLHNWADLSDFSNFVELIKMIKLKNLIMQKLNGDKDGSFGEQCGWLVHCSAGCGRTGTFIAIDALLQIFSSVMQRKDVNNVVFNIVNDLRKQRVSMVQTMRQYLMIYDLLIENMSLEKNKDEVFEKFIHEWDDIPVIQHFLEHYQKR